MNWYCKVKYLYLISLIIAFQTACRGEENRLPASIVVSLDEAYELKDIQNTHSIHLDENCVSFPGAVHKMKVVNDTIYILDIQKAPGLYVYDICGKQLYAYDCVGRGPGEFVGLMDFQVNKASVLLLDNVGKKILKLNKRGEFVSSKSIPDIAFSFAEEKENMFYVDMGNSIASDNSKLKLIKDGEVSSLLEVPEVMENITISPSNTLVKSNENIYYLPALENVIYEYKNGEVLRSIGFDFGSSWPGESFWLDNKGKHPLMIFRKLMEYPYVRELNFIVKDEILHLNFMREDKYFLFFYNMKNGKQQLYIDKDKRTYKPYDLSENKFYVMNKDESEILVFKLNLEALCLE